MPESPSELRNAAGNAARVAKRDTPYDFPLYCAEEQPSEGNPIIVLEVREGRAIAMILTREQNCKGVASLDDFELNSFRRSWRPTKAKQVARHRRRAIMFIWVLQNQRGKGLLNRMLGELEANLGHPLDELAHDLPFTEAAVKFWRKRAVRELYVI
jgi:hypothetical protein